MRRNSLKRLSLLLVLVMLCTTFVACSDKNSNTNDNAANNNSSNDNATNNSEQQGTNSNQTNEVTEDSKKGGSITLRVAADMGGYAWSPMFNQVLSQFVGAKYFIYDGNNRVNSMLDTYEVSDDGQVWTFKIKDGIKWHDGEEVTTDDVIFARDFWGQVPPQENGVADGSVYEAIDKLTFKVTLQAPNFSYINSVMGPMPKHIWQDVDPSKRNEVTDLKYSVGCGPFKVTEIQPGEYYKLERFDDYFGGAAYLDSIVFRVIPDQEAAIIALESGQVDGSLYTSNQSTRLENAQTFELYSAPGGTLQRIDFNLKNPIFEDVRTRQAIAYLVNKNVFVNQIMRGQAIVANSDFNCGDEFFDDSEVEKYEFNEDKAKELLAEAGWTMGSDGILEKNGEKFSIEFLNPNVEDVQKAGLIMQSDMKKVGIDLQLKNVDFSQYFNALYGAEPDFDLAYQGAGMPKGATEYWAYVYAYPVANPTRYENPTVTELFAKAASTADYNTKKEAYTEIQKILRQDVPDIPLYEGKSLYATNKKVNFSEAKFDGTGYITVYPNKIYVNK